ncbi:hypothetical protein AVEN_131959-1 [Araneus ventricosus]|uniref:Uncharacterized protein n=1 Tax=Araneus ventricosus TaxID=182803 RepID=A0A4Y2B4L0_ARAVE|nr:hypothetical protein AVEN_131959-1 [Araneus ventricosus]
MVITGRKIGTIGGMIKHLPAETLQKLRMKRAWSWSRLPETTICSSTWRGSWRSRIPPVTTTSRQTAATGWLRSPAIELFDACLQKFVSRYDKGFSSGGIVS